MSAISNDVTTSLSTDELLLEALRGMGPQTIESLCSSFPNMTWSQVFLAVDRLSRAGVVSLQPVQRCEYQVSLNGAVA
ncbi:MAG: hypothetical protein ACREI2_16020 [Nitrospiraceae bacterium]